MLLSGSLWYSGHLATQRSALSPMANLCETVFEFFPSWLQACKKRTAWFETRGHLPLVKGVDASQVKSSCPLACTVEQGISMCHCLLARADSRNSTRGYSPPLFPFNILPGRVETSCQDYSGYALERCTTDVRTRTQLFIALTVIFSLVFVCILLIAILGCIRRVKARRRVSSSVLARKKIQGRARAFLSSGNVKGNCRYDGGTHQCETCLSAHSNEDEGVEARESGIADQDIPVTPDGITDGWMQWIRQRANMVCMQAIYVTLLLILLSAASTMHLFTKTGAWYSAWSQSPYTSGSFYTTYSITQIA